MPLDDRRESAIELVWTAHSQRLKLQLQFLRRDFRFSQYLPMHEIPGIPEDSHEGDLGDGLFEQLQLLARDCQAGSQGRPRDVPTGPGEALRESQPNWVLHRHRHDGDFRCGRPGRIGCRRGSGNEDVNSEPDQLGGEGGKALGSSLRIVSLDDDVLPVCAENLVRID
jgi:hypothetical protein